MRLVGRADLDELGAARRHHLGQAERAADLDELPARDDHLAALGDRVEHDRGRGGVVVDDRGRLAAREPLQQPLDALVALRALAGLDIELEQRVAGELVVRSGRSACGASTARPRPVCRMMPVALIARAVVRPHRGARLGLHARHDGLADRRLRAAFCRFRKDKLPRFLDGFADRVHDDFPRDSLGRLLHFLVLEQDVHGGNLPQQSFLGRRHRLTSACGRAVGIANTCYTRAREHSSARRQKKRALEQRASSAPQS